MTQLKFAGTNKSTPPDGLVDCRRWRFQPYAAASSTTATAPATATRAGSRVHLQKGSLSAPYPSSNNLGFSFSCCIVHVVNAHPQIGAISRVSKPPNSKPTNILFPGLLPTSPFLHWPPIPSEYPISTPTFLKMAKKKKGAALGEPNAAANASPSLSPSPSPVPPPSPPLSAAGSSSASTGLQAPKTSATGKRPAQQQPKENPALIICRNKCAPILPLPLTRPRIWTC